MQFSSLTVGSTYDFAVATDGRDNLDLSLLDPGQLGQLQQSPGIDAIVLQGGDDTALDTDESRYFFGNAGNDSIDLAGGNDLASGGRDTDTLTGGDGNDSLFGNLGNDVLSGDAGDDLILGGQGEDRISGGAGNDYLGGDKGSDTLTGGDGADTFVLQAGFGVDTVTDFDVARDKFVLPVAVKFETLTFEEISATETEIAIEGASSPLVVVVNVGSQEFKESLFIEPQVTPGDTLETSFDLGVVEGIRRIDGFVGAAAPYDFFKFSIQDYTTLGVKTQLAGRANIDVFGDVNRDDRQSIEEVDYIVPLHRYSPVALPPGEYTVVVNYPGNEELYSYEFMFSKSPLDSAFDPPSSLRNSYDLGTINESISITEYVGTFDKSDIYKVDVSKPGLLLLRVDTDSYSPSIILDVDGDGIFDSRTDRKLGSSSDVGVGKYYIEVSSASSNIPGRVYQLDISLT